MKYAGMLWAIWYLYWLAAARRRVRETEQASAKREPLQGRVFYLAVMLLGFVLLFSRWPHIFMGPRLWSSTGNWFLFGLAVQAAGLAFAVWAREALGQNWAARVTTGGAQKLVIRGPYRIVRHPIYSGLLLATIGTAILRGEIRGFIGVLLILASVLFKLRREETALRQHFGDPYLDYARQVPGLVPGWPTRYRVHRAE